MAKISFRDRVKCERCEAQDHISGGKGAGTLFATGKNCFRQARTCTWDTGVAGHVRTTVEGSANDFNRKKSKHGFGHHFGAHNGTIWVPKSTTKRLQN